MIIDDDGNVEDGSDRGDESNGIDEDETIRVEIGEEGNGCRGNHH